MRRFGRRRKSSANKDVREYLGRFPERHDITREELHNATGWSTGAISGTPSWKGYVESKAQLAVKSDRREQFEQAVNAEDWDTVEAIQKAETDGQHEYPS